MAKGTLAYSLTEDRPDESRTADQPALQRLRQTLKALPKRVIACSGGIDSLLLASVAHREEGDTLVVHALSPAVPADATARVKTWAEREGWQLELVSSGEFDDEDYLSNPANRCYFCKSHLYSTLKQLASRVDRDSILLSGANLDDLGEYRPGLIAAAEHGVRHPYIEAEIDKANIRAIARYLALPFAELPASPCLASRLYTGTRVTDPRLRAVEACENLIRQRTATDVVRCRIRGEEMRVEVLPDHADKITPHLLAEVSREAASHRANINQVILDTEGYRPGRAFIFTETATDGEINYQEAQ